MRVIATLSGGMASAWCAKWALENFPKENVILYFNDTKWEHEDLYRFLNDLSLYFDHPITQDSDGRSPEELFYDHNMLANSRVPFCSVDLKAKMLQKFIRDGDILIFGIGIEEAHRAVRLNQVYGTIAEKKKINITLRFPLIEEQITKHEVHNFIAETGIEIPYLYRIGFSHNNCSGGCVRAGKKQWAHLLEVLPEVYAERERVEEEFREEYQKDVHILKDETLKQFRERMQEKKRLSPKTIFELIQEEYPNEEAATECIGICDTMN